MRKGYSLVVAFVAIAITSCSVKRDCVRDKFEVSDMRSSVNRMDSMMKVSSLIVSRDIELVIRYMSAPDSSGNQHVTAIATIHEKTSEESTTTEQAITRTDSTATKHEETIEHKETHTKASVMDHFQTILTCFTIALLLCSFIYLKRKQ